MYYAYVIQNVQSRKIYIGQTEDLKLRLQRHNGELPAKKTSYTKINKGTWKVVYKEGFASRGEAIKREKFLKSGQGRKFIKETVLNNTGQ